jgi:hypothetical protein
MHLHGILLGVEFCRVDLCSSEIIAFFDSPQGRMYPIPILVGVDGSEYVGFNLLPKPDFRIQEGMRSNVQANPA